MTAIYKRELKAFFHSVIGWLFLAANLFFAGLYFTALNLTYGLPSFAQTVSSVIFLLIITIPVLSMKILAEERRQKTDQLMLTAPVSVVQIVLGKYLAVATVFAASTAVMAAYPVILGQFGTVSYTESYTALLGYFLYGLAGLAVGLFLSSVTESQVIAAVLSFAALFVTYMMSGLTSLISSTGNLLTQGMGALDFMKRFQPFLQAQLDWSNVIYFVTVIAVMLFLTCQSIQKRRYSVSVKNMVFGAYNAAAIVLICAIAVVVNLAAAQIPASYKTVDMTSEKLYTLTEQTKTLVKGLTEPVNIYVLQAEENADSTLKNTLDNYEGLSEFVKVEYVNPVANPNFHTKYTADESITMNSLIVESARRYKVVSYSSVYESGFDSSTYTQTTTGYDGEGQVTSAIDYVTKENMPKIYMLSGHNELEFSNTFQNSIQKENIDTATLNLLEVDSVPEDAQCVVINAPTKDLSADDLEKLSAYAAQCGNLFITTAFTNEEQPKFRALLEEYGVSQIEGMVMEENREHYYQSPYYLLPSVETDSATSGVDSSGYLFMPYAQGFDVQQQEKITVTPLLTSSESSYSKVNFEQVQALGREEGDVDGPFTLALRAEKQTDVAKADGENIDGENTSTLYLFGSESLFSDSANEAVAGNNMTLFIGALTDTTEHTQSVSVPVKSYELSQITVPAAVSLTLGTLLTFVLPVLLLAAGLVIWMRRRRRL